MKIYSLRIFLPFASMAAAVLLGSCNLFNPVPNYRIVEPEAVVPKNFLYNPEPAYVAWMDTPLRVNYHEASISTILQDCPFAGFRYELYDIPDDMETVTLHALGQTRRQLLWAISHDHNLKMTLLTQDGGRPEVVLIRWRGTGETTERGIINL